MKINTDGKELSLYNIYPVVFVVKKEKEKKKTDGTLAPKKCIDARSSW